MIPESGSPDEMKAALLSECKRVPQIGEVFEFASGTLGSYVAEFIYALNDDGVIKFAFVVKHSAVDVWSGMLVYVRELNWLALLNAGSVRFAYNIIDDKGIFIEPAHRA